LEFGSASEERRDYLSKLYFYTKIIPLSARLFLKTGLTPNQITWLSFILCIIAGLCFLSGKYFYLITGAFLIQVGLIVDNVDGIVAKVKKSVSSYGKWLDTTTDRIGQVFMVMCAGVGLFISSGDIFRLYIGIAGSMFVIFSYYAVYLQRLIKPETYVSKTGKKIKERFKIGAGILRGGGAILIWLTVGAVFNLMYYVFVFYFFIFCGAYLVRLFIIYKRFMVNSVGSQDDNGR
jgi:phosphatidylglycerophosphate synthase